MGPPRAGSAYLVVPDDGPGPGVLVLHSWWGLTPWVKSVCESLADAGFTALAPDLSGGALPATRGDAAALLAQSDPNPTAGLVLSSVDALRAASADPSAPVAVVGFSMGGSWALWLAARLPGSVARVVTYYGSQSMDLSDLSAPVLGHFTGGDELVSADDRVELHAHLLLVGSGAEIVVHDGEPHFFAEDTPERMASADAAGRAWVRTLDFLRDGVAPGS